MRIVILFFIMVTANFSYVPKLYDFFESNHDAQIYVIGGGRSKGATWGIATELIITSFDQSQKHLILCTREIKQTVDYSSKLTIERLITRAGLRDFFDFYDKKTVNRSTGSEFIYTGLSKVTEDNVQGMEGVTRAWIGEAHKMLLSSWQKMEPTVREEGAKIYMDYNVQDAVTPVHMLFTDDPNAWPFKGRSDMPELAYVFLAYTDNPFNSGRIWQMAERQKKQYSRSDWEWIWLGKLRNNETKYVCSDADVLAAMQREVAYNANDLHVCGCDIAHMGGDEIAFYQRRGNKFMDAGYHNSMMRANDIKNALQAYIGFDKNCVIVMDNGHIGAAVADLMEDDGYYVERVNFGGKPWRDPEHCKDCATDMAFAFADMLPMLQLPVDQVMRAQITQREWRFIDNRGIRKLESKDDFKQHAVHLDGHKSPDRGDAVWLACYNQSGPRLIRPVCDVIKMWG